MTGIYGLLFILGLVLGALGQRWIHAEQSGRNKANPSPGESVLLPQPPAETSQLWLSYLRALEQAQFQGGFLARTAHELRSPLSSIMGLQQLILNDLCDSPEEERDCVAQSYAAAQTLNGLMDKLIGISRLAQGSQRFDLQPLALASLLEDIQSLVGLQLADRNVRLHLDPPPQGVFVTADYASLRQLWVMLVEGAIAQKAQEIALTWEVQEPWVKLTLWSDRPFTAWQDPWDTLVSQPLDLAALKQALGEGDRQGPGQHQLSPSMVLLTGQLIAELNGGRLSQPSQPEPDSAQLMPQLECWLPT